MTFDDGLLMILALTDTLLHFLGACSRAGAFSENLVVGRSARALVPTAFAAPLAALESFWRDDAPAPRAASG